MSALQGQRSTRSRLKALGLFFSVVFAFASLPPAPGARAETTLPVCSDLFAAAKAPWHKLIPFLKPYANFDLTEFTALRARYLERLKRGSAIHPGELNDSVKKLALLEAVSQQRGFDLYKFGESLESLDRSQIRAIQKALKKFEIDEQTDWSKAQRALVKIYLVTHYNPNTKGFWDQIKTPFTESDRELILHRVQLSLVKNSYMKALEDIGIVRSPQSIARLRERFHGAERVLRLGGQSALTAASFVVPFMNPGMPMVMATAPDLRRDLEERYMREGWGAVETEIYRHYGRSARTQTWINKGERVLVAVTIPIVVYFMWDEIWAINGKIHQVFFESEEESAERRRREDDVKLDAHQREAIIQYLLEREVALFLVGAKPYEATSAQVEETRRSLWNSAEIKEARRNYDGFTNKELVAAARDSMF